MKNFELLNNFVNETGLFAGVGKTKNGKSDLVFVSVDNINDSKYLADQNEHVISKMRGRFPQGVSSPKVFVEPDNVKEFLKGETDLWVAVIEPRLSARTLENIQNAVLGGAMCVVGTKDTPELVTVNGKQNCCMWYSLCEVGSPGFLSGMFG